jgi:hypothetical protein
MASTGARVGGKWRRGVNGEKGETGKKGGGGWEMCERGFGRRSYCNHDCSEHGNDSVDDGGCGAAWVAAAQRQTKYAYWAVYTARAGPRQRQRDTERQRSTLSIPVYVSKTVRADGCGPWFNSDEHDIGKGDGDGHIDGSDGLG